MCQPEIFKHFIMILRKYFCLFLLFLGGTQVFASGADSTTISFTLKSKELAVLFYYDTLYKEQHLLFQNTTDSLIRQVRQIEADKPIEFTFKIVFTDGHNGFKRIVKQFYLKGGDHISLQLENKVPVIAAAQPNNYFINDVVTPFDAFDALASLKRTSKEAFLSQIDSLHKSYRRDSLTLLAFENSVNMDPVLRHCWNAALKSGYYAAIFSYKNANKDWAASIEQQTSAVTAAFLSELDSFNRFRYSGMRRLVNAILFDRAKGDVTANLADEVSFGLTNFKELAFPSLLAHVEAIPEIGNQRYAATIQLMKDYAFKRNTVWYNAVTALSDNQIANAEQYRLSINNKTETTFAEILKKHAGKIVLIDFWASWCVPCRAEMPILKTKKSRFDPKDVAVITISLDEETKKEAWLSAMKEDGIFGAPDQYRLLDAKTSPLNKIFNIQLIPKYVVLDRQGRLLNRDFSRPSEADFEERLKRYITLY